MRTFAFNLRHLRAVAVTARYGSVSGAAHFVSLSQPAVTQGIAKVEALTGIDLFERRPGGMATTEAGRLLAVRVEQAEEKLRQGFEAIRKPGSGGFSAAAQLLTMAQFRALLAFAAAGSFVGAARAIDLSQPSLHRSIRDLERVCGAAMLVRAGRGVALTPAGLRLVRAFRLALGELEAGLEEIDGLRGEAGGIVRIGSMPLARARLLPVAVARFHALYPAARIEIVEGSHAELIERLRDGMLDLLIGALRAPDPGPDVTQLPLFEDRLMIVGGRDHPLVRHKAPDAGELAAYPWVIAREGTPMRRHWEAIFSSRGVPLPAVPVTCGSMSVIRTLLAEGRFLTLLSPDQVRLEIATGVLAAIGKPIPETLRPIGATTRRDWRPTPAQAAILALLTTCAQESRPPEIE